VKQLLEENEKHNGKNQVVVIDVKEDDSLVRQVLTPQQLSGLRRVYADITDTDTVVKLALELKPNIIVHLAGLQIPTCRANPVLGAKVNVIGTLNMFEAARLLKEKHNHRCNVIYASSSAVTGSPEDYANQTGPIPDDASHKPMTHYGVFKTANEGNARVYWAEHKIPSVGLRPFTVYGVGREIGLTSGPTKALKATILGRESYTIQFTGDLCVSFVEDIASNFIGCGRARIDNAYALNIKGDVISVDEWIRLCEEAVPEAKGRVKKSGNPLPYPVHFLETGLEHVLQQKPVPTTSPREGIRKTAEHFRRLKAAGLLHDRDL